MLVKKIMSFIMAIVVAVSVLMMPMNADAMAAGDYLAVASVFDADYYYACYPDLALSIGQDYNGLLNHFVTAGIYEGRSASYEFNPMYYRNAYPDLNAAYGDNMLLYCKHYVDTGRAEGRVGNSPNAKVVDTSATNINVSLGNPQLLSSRTTRYNANIPRAINVGLATDAINGTIVLPGQQFSYTNTVGPRTTARGYVEAPVYVNGEHSTGIGGGICQVSSTLYAAMKDCGLPATERHAHSLPVSYLPAGYDATISGTALDLKFVNIYEQPLYIEAIADGGKLTISLYLLY